MRAIAVSAASWVVLLTVVGCTVSRDGATTDLVAETRRAADAARLEASAPAAGPSGSDPASEIEADAIPVVDWGADLFAEAEEPAAEEPLTDDNTALEDPVTASPLDDLATIDPQLFEAEPVQELGVADGGPPTFDIPMEVNAQVLAWVDIYSGPMRGAFPAGLERSGRYVEMFRRIFAEEGIPEDLVYMAAVESGFKTSAYSRAHARGIFQFIASTARRYDLRVDYWVDERSDPEKSARAAAAYMKKLYGDFGDWHLALAAYNAGEGKIKRGLAASGKRDFWGLARTRHIRRETKNHVPAILAATLISKQPHVYGLEHRPDPPLVYDTIEVKGATDLRVLARCAETDVATMKELNPALRRNQTPRDGTTDVRVPVGAGQRTLAALARIPEGERVLYARHRVQRGDTLSLIAARHGVGVSAIQQANNMGHRTLIRVGQMLRIPTSAAGSYADVDGVAVASHDRDGTLVTYTVRRGDTLSGIARRHRTTARCIAVASGISLDKTLRVGDRLEVVPGTTSPEQARRVARREGTTVASNGHGSPADQVIHTVRRGETLWRIASRYQTSVAALCSLNELSPQSVIHPGTKLVVGYK